MKNIYLDVDGVIVRDNLGNFGKPALHLPWLFSILGNGQADSLFKVYWLTTHCMDGDDTQVMNFLEKKVEAHIFDLIKRMKIQPTSWKEMKTEAIDFTQDFLWFDDDVSLKDKEVLRTNRAENKLIEIDLTKDKHQIQRIIHSGLLGKEFFQKQIEI